MLCISVITEGSSCLKNWVLLHQLVYSVAVWNLNSCFSKCPVLRLSDVRAVGGTGGTGSSSYMHILSLSSINTLTHTVNISVWDVAAEGGWGSCKLSLVFLSTTQSLAPDCVPHMSAGFLTAKAARWHAVLLLCSQCPRSSRAARSSSRSTEWWTAFTGSLELLQISRNCGKEAQTDQQPLPLCFHRRHWPVWYFLNAICNAVYRGTGRAFRDFMWHAWEAAEYFVRLWWKA